MAERKTYTAEDFIGCNGRRVTVDAVIEDVCPEVGPNIRIRFPLEDMSTLVAKSAIVEILPEEIKAGDRVKTASGADAAVLAISTDLDGSTLAGVRLSSGGHCWLGTDLLTLVERG